VRARFKKKKIELHLVSALTGEGVREVVYALAALLAEER